ncbi:MAG TPA: NUDIX hydrolase [Thermoanaerobaculia bacterium]|nr:NUDIX hydrolase [Thermoanaerobaculia bacterium]
MRSPRRWITRRRERTFEHPLLAVDRVLVSPEAAEPADAHQREVLSLASPDWVNVVALTGGGRPDGPEVVLVRQWRFAVAAPTLEIPGGIVDDGETPLLAARRELLEETGYASESWRALGSVHPNPAILTNRCHTFLALDAELHDAPCGDGDEEIEVATMPLTAIPRAIAGGEISHSLVIAAFHLLGLAGLDAGRTAAPVP